MNKSVEGMDPATATNDGLLITSLLQGEEAAFLSLIDHYQASMLRICRMYISDPAVAEEVVQDTWLSMLQGLRRFEGRSSFKTWLFTILANKARTRAKRERRSISFSDLEDSTLEEPEPAVDPNRFLPEGYQWAGGWAVKPQPWGSSIEQATLSKELMDYIEAAIQRLPESQRVVISMRDVQGWRSEEVCNVLGLSESNQRVLLHRARSKLRRALEQYYDEKVNEI